MRVERNCGRYRNYLILSDPDGLGESYRIRMLEKNSLKGLLPCQVQRMNGDILLCYDVTGRISLEEYLQNHMMEKDRMEGLLAAVIHAEEELADYLLEEDGLLLQPEFIYLDQDRGQEQIRFCFFPPREKEEGGMKGLAEFLLPRLSHSDREAVMLGYSFYEKACRERLDLEGLKRLLYQGKREEEKLPGEEADLSRYREGGESLRPAGSSAAGCAQTALAGRPDEERVSMLRRLWDSLERRTHTFVTAVGRIVLYCRRKIFCRERTGREGNTYLRKQRQREARIRHAGQEETSPDPAGTAEGRPWLTGEEESFLQSFPDGDPSEPVGGEGETVCLRAPASDWPAEERARLIAAGGPVSPLILSRDLHLIGRKKEMVDLVVSARTMSRMHARLVWDGRDYRMFDLNSRNGTQINGKRLGSGEVHVLTSGDQVEFGDMRFQYYQKDR